MSVENGKYVWSDETESIFKENSGKEEFSEEISDLIFKSKRAWRALDNDTLEYEKYKKWLPELLKSLNL